MPSAVVRMTVAMASAALLAGLLPGGQAGAAWPGTNGKILFEKIGSDGRTVVAKDGLAGSEAEVVHGPHPAGCTTCGARDGRYSPNGTKIVYSETGGAGQQIFVATVDSAGLVTGTPTQVTTVGTDNNSPSWYPDSTRIAFYSRRDAPNGEIYEMDTAVGETSVTRLTNNKTPTVDPFDGSPFVSPNGSTIMFNSDQGSPNSSQIWLMDADPAHAVSGVAPHRRRLFPTTAQFDSGSSWAPDGSRLAFSSHQTGNFDVFVVNLTGTDASDIVAGAVTNLTPGSSNGDTRAIFSPDGTKILYESVVPPTPANPFPNPDMYVVGSTAAGPAPALVVASASPTDWARTAGSGTTHHAPADFDGNGSTDVSVFRPSNGTWYVNGGATTTWGTSGDIPVPGNYTGTATTNVAVYRPGSAGTWYINGGPIVTWGTTGDIPVPGDYNGDGTTDIAVFRPNTGTWFVNGGAVTNFGTAGDIPVPGDYNGDGTTDIAVYRPSTGTWYVNGGGITNWGISGDVPVPGDYNGDGTTDIAVFRPSTGTWYVNGGAIVNWGTSGDIPEPGNYSGTATTDIAVYRPGTNTWFVRSGATTTWGTTDDIPLPLPAAIRMASFPGP